MYDVRFSRFAQKRPVEMSGATFDFYTMNTFQSQYFFNFAQELLNRYSINTSKNLYPSKTHDSPIARKPQPIRSLENPSPSDHSVTRANQIPGNQIIFLIGLYIFWAKLEWFNFNSLQMVLI